MAIAEPAPQTVDTAHRRKRVSELLVQGYEHGEMANLLGVSRPTITLDVKWIEANCRHESAETLRVEKQIQVRRLEGLYHQYMDAYVKSCEERKKKLTKIRKHGTAAGGEGFGEKDEAEQGSVTEQNPAGDVRFLNGARDTTVKRLEFTVGYPPVKAIVARAENVAAWRQVIEKGDLTAEELRALESIQTKVLAALKDGSGSNGKGNGHVIDIKPRDGGDGIGDPDLI